MMIIIISAAPMADLMYERSKDHIEWLQQYKNPWLDSIMHLFSYLG